MLYVVGLGPGSKELMTEEACQVTENTHTIAGYATYVCLIEDMIEGKELVATGMRGEIEWCKKALEVAATGKDAAIISSGDAGIYGMAGLALELAGKIDTHVDVKVIPSVAASIAAAAHLGAPLMNDFCHVSLSDLMTSWDVTTERVDAAAKADFVICLYDPHSKGRPYHLCKALDIILKYKSPDTVIGVGKDATRSKEIGKATMIKDLDETEINMTSIVIVGNRNTYVEDDRMITPRGYTL